jgi:hypothetical protein
MSTSSNNPEQSFTTQDVDVWLLAAAEKHAAIHLKAAYPGNGHALHEAFTDMSLLLLEAFEEVRVMSAQLREESQTARSRSIALRDHYAQLLGQSVAAMERLGQFIPPPPEEIRQAESQMLEMFREGNGREKQHE